MFTKENDIRTEAALSTETVVFIIPNTERSSQRTYHTTLKSGIQAIWKPHPFRYKAEVAAYKVDRRLGFNLVPPTVQRELNGEVGSLQRFIHGKPPIKHQWHVHEPQIQADLDKQSLFDILVHNTDRTRTSNWLIAGSRVVSFDHAGTFTAIGFICPNCQCHDPNHDYTKELDHPYVCKYCKHSRAEYTPDAFRTSKIVEKYIEGASRFLASEEASAIVENIRSTIADTDFHSELSGYMSRAELSAFLVRMRAVAALAL
ncbi:MAG: hypothetical protein AB7G93_10010 [Bdellovibrionales bacterium]